MGNCFCIQNEETSALFEDSLDNVDNLDESTHQFQQIPNVSHSRQDYSVRHSTDTRQQQQQDSDDNQQLFFPNPSRGFPLHELSEEDQIRIAKRLGLLLRLPCLRYQSSMAEKMRECTICMCDYVVNDQLRYLPCLHAYHKHCIDDWLVRSFTCPDCCQSVEPALMSSYILP